MFVGDRTTASTSQAGAAAVIGTYWHPDCCQLLYTGLESEGVLGELEDADEADDAEEGERRARLEVVGGAALAGRQLVEERHVVRYQRRRVDERLEVAAERHLGRARHEPHDQLEREPRVADRLDDEERTAPVRLAVRQTVGLGEAIATAVHAPTTRGTRPSRSAVASGERCELACTRRARRGRTGRSAAASRCRAGRWRRASS